MDHVMQYRKLIKDHLTHIVNLINRRPTPGVDAMCIFDDERGHYLLAKYGWTDRGRTRAISLYVRLRDGKIWIEEDWTETGIANVLIEAGVPEEDIVLAFQPPSSRIVAELAPS